MNEQALYDALLDALYATFGRHEGFRVAHAKGVLVKGIFTASATASTISKAPHLQGTPVPVLLRFSNFSGLPGTADGDPMASPHGLAVRFTLPDNSFTDIVGHSYNGFPVATPQAFLTFLQSIAANGGDTPDPEPLASFLQQNPIAKTFLETPKPAPRSYDSIPYFGVNAFMFTNAKGEQRFGRYMIVPATEQAVLSDEQAEKKSADYLQNDITERLAKGKLNMYLMLQIATAKDDVNDGSVAWPATNPMIKLGTFTLESALPAATQQSEQSRIGFSPGYLTDGIEASADPMIKARAGIYQRALARRAPANTSRR